MIYEEIVVIFIGKEKVNLEIGFVEIIILL